ncbi:MAG: hypothetical protein GEV09_09320 [Pseudonocardiaceae bacterium]|nr:hypothetical protein [Pseudonocardiaceae bacterium]
MLAIGAGRAVPPVTPLCTPSEPELTELSGLVADGQRWFAVADGGQRLEVFVLDPTSCAVDDVITAGVNPYDIEDLALAADGALWLADTGDNDLDRETVALHRLTRDGEATLFRLVYPDGPHDAEALLLDRAGVPYVVTKEALGAAGVYRPAGTLAAPGPTPLQRVASVRLGPTDTAGGPVGSVGSTLVTGAATSADGDVLAVRTYTDAYLYAVGEGDVATALERAPVRAPVRVPLPGEPQGEAVALAPDGTLLSASEGAAGPAPIRAVRGATTLVTPPAGSVAPAPAGPVGDGPPGVGGDPGGDAADGGLPAWQGAVLAVAVATVLVAVSGRRRRT